MHLISLGRECTWLSMKYSANVHLGEEPMQPAYVFFISVVVQIPLAGTLSDEAEGPLVPAPPPSHTPSFSCCFRAAPSSCSYYTPLFYCWWGLFFSNTLSRFLLFLTGQIILLLLLLLRELLFLFLLFLLVFPLLLLFSIISAGATGGYICSYAE